MKILNFIICDDIRNELGNKHSLMGIYDDVIEFSVGPEKKNQWPKVMRLGIFAKVIFDDNDKEIRVTTFKINIDYNNNKSIIAEGILPSELILKSKKINLAVVHNNFIFKDIGEIEFSIDFYNNNKELVATLIPDYKLKVLERIV